MRKRPFALDWLPTLGLLGLASGLAAIFGFLGRQPALKNRMPEFVALSLLAGALYIVGVYCVEKFPLGPAALAVILGGTLLFRLQLLPAPPSLSEDVYRYQWEGRVERAGLNPYRVFPSMPRLQRFQEPQHPLETGRTTPTLYPPLSEIAFSWIRTVAGYKRLFIAFDLGSAAVVLLLLAYLRQPLHRVLAYAWNPTVIVSFALCGHNDSLAVLLLLTANFLIIGHAAALSIAVLALSFLAKLFPVLLLPVFLQRTRSVYAGIFAVVVVAGYVPYLEAGTDLVKGLRDYAVGWEGNDSLLRLIRHAQYSKAQAELVAGALVLLLVAYAVRERMGPLRASLLLTAGALFLSPNAFPWYFTWFVPFLCFSPSIPLLLMSVTAVLGYSPVIAYAAGQPYRDSPLFLFLEYAPVFCWLAWDAWKRIGIRDSGGRTSRLAN